MSSNEKLSTSSQRFDNAPCGYLVFDDSGNILETNSRLRNWLGKTASELSKLHVTHVFSGGSRIVYETSIAPLLSLKGEVESASLDLLSKDGGKLPVIMSAENSGTGSTRATTLVFLLADARRKFERDLATARAEAEAQLSITRREGELREQFVAILGHDLRNPLASISSAVRMLSQEPLSDRGSEIIKLTQGSVQRMSRLIDNVLDFARNRLGGGIELNLSDGATLEAEIRQVVDELLSAQPDREILIDISKMATVKCDVPRVWQLLSNLLGNALIYGDPKQAIHVGLGTSPDGEVELSVRNGGEPIPPSAMGRLFDPFVRSTNHSDRMGLGLGLYIASEIAKAHGGTLNVHSNEEWTKFILRIPQERAEG